MKLRVVDGAQYQQRLTNYDYDMIQNTWTSSLSPGNEQLFRWSTAAAKTPGTYNFAGVENPAADAMIQAMLAAKSEADFISAVRALDRVLLSGEYVDPAVLHPQAVGRLLDAVAASREDAAVRLQRRKLVVGGREMTGASDELPRALQHGGLCHRPRGGGAAAAPGPARHRRCQDARPAEVWTFAAARGRGAAHRRRRCRPWAWSPGARILIRLENTSAYALLFFGAIAGGFVPLPTSAQLTEHEVHFLLEDSGAEAIALGP